MTDKREQIIQAALKLFIERGFHNTSTAAISKEAGVATGTLFLYFPTKEDLINTLYKESKGRLAIALQEGFPAEGGMKAKLEHLWHNAIRYSLENMDAFRFIHMFKNSPLITHLTREETAPSADFAISFIKEGIQSGEIKNIDIELLFLIIDNLMAATVNFASGKSARQRKQIADASFDLFWNGITNKH